MGVWIDPEDVAYDAYWEEVEGDNAPGNVGDRGNDRERVAGVSVQTEQDLRVVPGRDTQDAQGEGDR